MLKPEVTIIIPCRNEEKFIGNALDSILHCDYPKEHLEVLVVDGMSEDSTKKIVLQYKEKYPFIKLYDNPDKIVPTALNLGIREACGNIIMRMDAHTTYKSDYITKCVKYLLDFDVDNVGGICRTIPGDSTLEAQAIAAALSSPFGVGNSYFRIGLNEPRSVDTVPFGCYKRTIFDKIGQFNENLVRNQDIEFNVRLKNTGGKILLMPDIISDYHSRATLKDFVKNNFWNGFWVIYSSKFAKMPFSLRHLIPLSFILSIVINGILSFYSYHFAYILAFIVSLYCIVNVVFSLTLSQGRNLRYFIDLFAAFSVLHCSYGLGSVWGLIKRFILIEEKK